MQLILAGLGGALLVGLFVWSYSRILYWRTSFYTIDNNYASAVDRAMELERERTQLEDNNEYLRNTIAQILQRPSIATLRDDQVQLLAQLIQSQNTAPDKMN